MKFDKVFLYDSFNSVNIAFNDPTFMLPKTSPFTCFCEEKIAVGFENEKHDKYQTIRICKTKSYFGLWYDDFSASNFLAALHYKINNNDIKIEYMNLYDNEHTYYVDCVQLTNVESRRLNKSLIQYIKNLAKKENKRKVIVDVHRNLRIFNKYYLPAGFVATNRKSEGNAFWIEAEIVLDVNTA